MDKSEFDWNVHQRGDDRYEITRFGPKFNSELELSADAGKISGTYVRSGPHFDWPITGTYDEQGKVKITIGVPLGLDVTLVGKIQRR